MLTRFLPLLLVLFISVLASGCSLKDDSSNDAEPLFKVEQVLSGPSIANRDACTAFVLTITTNDRDSNPFPTDVPFLLGGNGAGTFYTDEACTTPLPSSVLIVPTGGTTASFYFKGPQAESLVFNSTASTGESVTLPVTVQ